MQLPHVSCRPDYHVLNFFYDNENSCALTVLTNNVRFHIIADAGKLQKGSVGQEYARLLQAVKETDADEVAPLSSDSGIDVSHDEKNDVNKLAACHGGADAEEMLHRWMLAPLQSSMHKLAPESESSHQETLEEWYTGPTHFFNLETHDKVLQAIELEPSADLQRRIKSLLHQIAVPKYIRNIDVPWFESSELTVLDGSNSPPPYHPGRVQTKSGEVYHLKLVDKDEPQPTKREIALLNSISEKGLHDKLRCPKLEALVAYSDDHSKIMGFLQTDIPDPCPLTTKLDTKTPQQLRDRWASESAAMVDNLHEHGIVWGDAKADNFMVDSDDRLWIIDFGGSYTEGWVDAELNETEEGDDMGVEKIVTALHDPVNNTWDPDTEKDSGDSEKAEEKSRHGKKRKADVDSADEKADDAKRRCHDNTRSRTPDC